MAVDIVAFLGGLMLVTGASVVLSRSLDRIGERFGFTQALLGVITALGADAPEISSALTALHGGRHAVAFGIVFGSNIFNLAALLGFSAVAARGIRVRPETVWLNGAISIVLTLVASAILLELLPAWTGLACAALVYVPFVVLAAVGVGRLRMLRSFPAATDFLRAALREDDALAAALARFRPGVPAAGFVALVAIVGGSILAVNAARSRRCGSRAWARDRQSSPKRSAATPSTSSPASSSRLRCRERSRRSAPPTAPLPGG